MRIQRNLSSGNQAEITYGGRYKKRQNCVSRIIL